MNSVTRVQFLDKTICISLSANTLWKGVNPTILPPAMDKIVGQTVLFNLVMVTSLGEGEL